MKKRISIDQLKPGMYVVELDKLWWQTPFFSHKRTIKGERDLMLLRQCGVREVVIDTAQGDDIDIAAPAALVACEATAEKQGESGPPQSPSQPVPDASQSLLAALAVEIPVAHTVRRETLAAVQGIFEGVKTGSAIDSAAVRHTVTSLMESVLRSPAAALLLAQMRRFDADLFAHAVDVCTLALVVGSAQGYTLEHLEVLSTGALLHDVGKMRLPRNLLRQSKDYNEQDRSLLQQHPLLGATLLAQSESIHEDVRRIVAEHHERADGSGYPAGRTNTQLFPLSHLVSILNLYDAFVSGRDGQPPASPTHALRQLYQLGKRGQCDPVWVERVICALGIYPIGTVVELNTGEQGIVLATHPTQALRPMVQIVEDRAVAPRATPQLVDLSKPAKKSETERAILRAADPAVARVILTHYGEKHFGQARVL